MHLNIKYLIKLFRQYIILRNNLSDRLCDTSASGEYEETPPNTEYKRLMRGLPTLNIILFCFVSRYILSEIIKQSYNILRKKFNLVFNTK